MTERDTLLARAARCYLDAGLTDDACRCFEKMGDAMRTARLHEQQGRWLQAAQQFQQASAWLEAARCYRACRHYADAADCLVQGGDPLQAGWLLADSLHQYQRAAAIAETAATGGSLAEQLLSILVKARCEAGREQPSVAARRLLDMIEQLPELPPGLMRQQVETWALSVAQYLHRPDLTALIHAASLRAATPGASRRWEQWAQHSLGDASGIPSAALDAAQTALSA